MLSPTGAVSGRMAAIIASDAPGGPDSARFTPLEPQQVVSCDLEPLHVISSQMEPQQQVLSAQLQPEQVASEIPEHNDFPNDECSISKHTSRLS